MKKQNTSVVPKHAYFEQGFIVEVRRYMANEPPGKRNRVWYPNSDRACAGFQDDDIRNAWLYDERRAAADSAEEFTFDNPGHAGSRYTHKIDPCRDKAFVRHVTMYFNTDGEVVCVAITQDS